MSRRFRLLVSTLRRVEVRSAAGLVLLMGALASLGIAWRYAHLSLNVTSSMPIGLYRDEEPPATLRRGDIVVVCAPPLAAALGARRGYLPRGTCAHETAPLLKFVAAVAGDRIDCDRDGVVVDGAPLGRSRPLRRDGARRLMRGCNAHNVRLRAHEIWLFAPEPRSFDSRYFGAVSATAVIWRASPIVVMGPIDRDALGQKSQKF